MLLDNDKIARSQEQRMNLYMISLLESIDNKLSKLIPEEPTPQIEEVVVEKKSRKKKTEVIDNANE